MARPLRIHYAGAVYHVFEIEGRLQGNLGYGEFGAMLRTITGALPWRRANDQNIKTLSVSLPV
jgi:hypothetical protein